MILRRKRTTPEVQASFDAFRDVLVHLEPAKAALTDVMPTTRMPGRPLPDALAEFEEGLARSEERMPAWRTPELEPEWLACEQGLADAMSRARRFREDAPELGGLRGADLGGGGADGSAGRVRHGRGALPGARRALIAGLPGGRSRDSLPG